MSENDFPHMAVIDAMAPDMRALVHEFGFKIVSAMIDDGYTDAKSLRPLLKSWLARRQQEWLATDYVAQIVRPHVTRAVFR